MKLEQARVINEHRKIKWEWMKATAEQMKMKFEEMKMELEHTQEAKV